MRVAAASALLLAAGCSASPKVLIYGDSWGQTAALLRALPSMFKRHNRTDVTVRSTAISGTTACQWAKTPNDLADAAAALKADFVWYTLGGNDMLDGVHKDCLNSCPVGTRTECSIKCDADYMPTMTQCADASLSPLFAKMPHIKVLYTWYDTPCASDDCMPCSYAPECGHNNTCLNTGNIWWHDNFAVPLAAKYDGMTTINLMGCAQAAGGVAGASCGHPVMDQGSPCDLLSIGCVHPGLKGWVPETEGMWDQYFSKELPPPTDA